MMVLRHLREDRIRIMVGEELTYENSSKLETILYFCFVFRFGVSRYLLEDASTVPFWLPVMAYKTPFVSNSMQKKNKSVCFEKIYVSELYIIYVERTMFSTIFL